MLFYFQRPIWMSHLKLMRKLKPYITTTDRRYLLSWNSQLICSVYLIFLWLWILRQCLNWLESKIEYLLKFDSLKVTHWLTPEKFRQKRTDPTITYTRQTILTTQSLDFCFIFQCFCLILKIQRFTWNERWINLVCCRLLTSAQKHTLCAKRNHSTNLWFSQWFAHNPHRFGAFSCFHTLNECTTDVYISFSCVGGRKPYFVRILLVFEWFVGIFFYRI